MKIIANPPYCRDLHLKIMREMLKHSNNIVSLSPIRWLQETEVEAPKAEAFPKDAIMTEAK